MSLHEYYAKQDVSVSFRNLQSTADLARHTQARAAFYTDKLKLPSAFFRGLRMAEFGPDTGENALSFAQWGAHLVLAEPNVAAHPVILDYFEKFGLSSQLEMLRVDTLEHFEDDAAFDFINAEGFVGSIQPMQVWLRAMDRLLAREGLFVVSYFERTGAWMEQAVNALVRTLARGMAPMEAAKLVMEKKWAAVSHSRPFEAWVMDVLDNPYARQRFHLDAGALMREAASAGFRLHASVPQHQDPLWVGWYKQVMAREDYLARSEAFIARSRLGWLLGAPCFWSGSAEHAAELGARIDATLAAFDAAIETPGQGGVAEAVAALAQWAETHQQSFLTGTPWRDALAGLRALAQAFLNAH